MQQIKALLEHPGICNTGDTDKNLCESKHLNNFLTTATTLNKAPLATIVLFCDREVVTVRTAPVPITRATLSSGPAVTAVATRRVVVPATQSIVGEERPSGSAWTGVRSKRMSRTFADLALIDTCKIQTLQRHDTKFAAFINGITNNSAADNMGRNEEQKACLHVRNSMRVIINLSGTRDGGSRKVRPTRLRR
jgi:hypothetical protein